MFSNVGEYKACGMFTLGHFILIVITIIGIFTALKKSVNKNTVEVHKICNNNRIYIRNYKNNL